MSYQGYFDRAFGGDVASNSGWSDFCRWADDLPFDELAHLVHHGYATEPDGLADELRDALAEHVPPADVASTAQGILLLLARWPDDAESFIISDGLGSGEDADQPSAARDMAIVLRDTNERFPTIDDLYRMTADELSALLERLYDALAVLGKSHGFMDADLKRVVAQIDDLHADAIFAARLLGFAAPFLPQINVDMTAVGGKDLANADLAIKIPNPFDVWGRLDGFRFPWLTSAMNWLAGKHVATTEDFRKMEADAKAQAITAPALTPEQVGKLQAAIGESLQRGEDFRSFKGRLSTDVKSSLTDAEAQTQFRTNTHQAYIAGKDESLSRPFVRKTLPYILFVSTRDTRTRPTHAALDGFVCSIDDPAYAVLKRALADWNCRCTLISLNAEQAKKYTIKTYADLPEIVLAAYGNPLTV